MTKEKKQKTIQNSKEKEKNHQLILFNDDVNTFDYVMDTLMDVCDHTAIQAEQCTMIAHYNGKCGVKTGTLEEVLELSIVLIDRGLDVEVQ